MVVTDLASSALPIGAGSTYFITVMSVVSTVSGCWWSAAKDGNTLLLVYLHLYVDVYGNDDNVGYDVQSAHAEEDVWIIEGNLLRCLHHKSGRH